MSGTARSRWRWSKSIDPSPARGRCSSAWKRSASAAASYTYGEADFAEAVSLLASGAIRMDGWTEFCVLEETAAAFEALDSGVSPYGKVIVKPNGCV
ncbi:hypothetical protein [Cohnella sp. GCM10012308]|uniref:hypothetical protein n=1 Tax=Cohnella sp. GCM10012308 TaxID=3317329 RepID=UPI003612D632